MNLSFNIFSFLIGTVILISTSFNAVFSNNTTALSSDIEFVENKGQLGEGAFVSDVLFYTQEKGSNIFISQAGFKICITKETSVEKNDELDMVYPKVERTEIVTNWLTSTLVNSNQEVEVLKGGVKSGKRNYFYAHAPEGIINVGSYSDITINQIYNGIDIKWYTKNEQIKYDFIVQPGADPNQIKWEIQGANEIKVNDRGELLIRTDIGEIIEDPPIVYQGEDKIKSKWMVQGNVVSYEIEDYNNSEVLIIDPVIRLWATYIGGSIFDQVFAVDVDNSSNIYTVGNTASINNIATSGSFQDTLHGSQDCFVSKFNSDGELEWSTYYGGSQNDNGRGIEVYNNELVFVSGQAGSANFPVTSGSHQTSLGGSGDVFILCFETDGTRKWATFYGGEESDGGGYMSVDNSGNIYICGSTLSTTNISSSGAHQESHSTGGGDSDAFLAKMDKNGTKIWGTYFGDVDLDFGLKCFAGPSGKVFLAGWTRSTNNLSTSGSHQISNAGERDGFLAKFSSNGTLDWSTFYGGTASDDITCVTEGSDGAIYITGFTESDQGIATQGAHRTTQEHYESFVAKFNSSGARQWGTYFGGKGDDLSYGCALDPFSSILIVGRTESASGIATSNAFQESIGGYDDAFIARFDDDGVLLASSYYGGPDDETAISVVTDNADIYIVGLTSSLADIASPGCHQETYGGGNNDGFIVKMRHNPVGIEIVEEDSPAFNMGPNPVKDQITMWFEEERTGVISVYSSTAELVYSQKIEKAEKALIIELPDHLVNGMYYLKFESAEKVESNRFIILR